MSQAPVAEVKVMSTARKKFRATWFSGVAFIGAAAIYGAACSSTPVDPPGPAADSGPKGSSSLGITLDDTTLWVVNPESDSVSVIDTASKTLVKEIFLTGAAPKVDPVSKRFDPVASPRAIALLESKKKAYVAGQTSGVVYVLDMTGKTVTSSIPVSAGPVSVVAAADGSGVYVVSHEAGEISKIDPATDEVVATAPVSEHPWGITVSADGKTLLVTHLLLDPGVTTLDAETLTVKGKVPLAEQAPSAPFDKRIPNGVVRGAYQAVPRPGTGELWVPHLLLAVKTPQPDLDFESTVFPTISTLDADATAEGRRLLFKPAVGGVQGAFSDSVSGPRAVAFTPDGKLALVALAQSEDVMVFDAEAGTELSLVRPVLSSVLEGIVVDHAGKKAYVDGRGSHNVTVLKIDATDKLSPVVKDGEPIERLESDPMPADMRLGMRLFYTANSAAFPITKNFWVACSSCHIEGGSDAVTWIFKQGPRDTPSNAGGPINTGFLLRQGLRATINQYDTTIQDEQGGNYHADQASQKPDLDALAAFVNYGIPLPPNPYLAKDGTLTEAQARGKTTFQAACADCHSGSFYTDSGKDNPTLDFKGPIVLHDLGTCILKGDHPDKPFADVSGATHTACDFDTPTLRGIFATAPYFHDGSALTLEEVVDRLPSSAKLPADEKADLVAYILTL
jgi:YVTN family beta-propeller protein